MRAGHTNPEKLHLIIEDDGFYLLLGTKRILNFHYSDPNRGYILRIIAPFKGNISGIRYEEIDFQFDLHDKDTGVFHA